MQQSIGMVDLQVSRDALRAEPAFINRKIVTWLKTNNMILFDQQVHTALDSAIGTMCRDYTINYAVCTPTTVWRVMEMRPVCFNDLIQILYFAHFVSTVFREPLKTGSVGCGRLAYASPRMIRLQRGQ